MFRNQRRRDRQFLDSLRGRVRVGGCSDCDARWAVGMDDRGHYRLNVWHRSTCPAAAGYVTWRPSQAVG